MRYFHRIRNRKRFFEGWYFKHQKADRSLALIPAVFVDQKGHPTAVLQILTPKQSWQFSFPLCEFSSEEDQLSIRMDRSYFTERGCTLNLHNEEVTIEGRLDYGPLMMLDKDIMGPFRFWPGMECRHGVISLYHTVSGQIKINEETLDFEDGIGYIEMDWGKSFPKCYLWTHCAWKDDSENSLMVAAASIPIFKTSFKGCLSCLMIHQKQVVLATYFGARIMQMSEDRLVIHQNRLRLEIQCLQPRPVELQAPKEGKLRIPVHESLRCTVRYRLFEEKECVLDVTQEEASFESVFLPFSR